MSKSENKNQSFSAHSLEKSIEKPLKEATEVQVLLEKAMAEFRQLASLKDDGDNVLMDKSSK